MSQQTTQAPSTEETHDTYLDATITERFFRCGVASFLMLGVLRCTNKPIAA